LDAELSEQALACGNPRLERGQPFLEPEVREHDAGERLGRVGEDADPAPGRGKSPHRSARRRVSPDVQGSAVFAPATEQGAPVSRAEAIELRRGCRWVGGKRAGVAAEDRARLLEPVAPERPRVAEHTVERHGERARHASLRTTPRCQRRIPMATPTASLAASVGDPCRPGTNVWWNSSLAA